MKSLKFAALILAAPLGLLANTAVDRQIEETAESSFNYRVALEDHVKVRVSDGVVQLTGKVSNDEQCRIAEDTVADIPGVVRVENQIQVKGEREGSDGMTALKVRSRLLVKGNVSLKDTRVDVKDGVVILSGKADDQAQKELTEECAKDVDGVRGVRN
ncbi:MAG: osmY, partial [Verrucomicrobia bacterium]|nr:osmY [Verrucomicrobiota bacterium]